MIRADIGIKTRPGVCGTSRPVCLRLSPWVNRELASASYEVRLGPSISLASLAAEADRIDRIEVFSH
jgi:hypothetical protein